MPAQAELAADAPLLDIRDLSKVYHPRGSVLRRLAGAPAPRLAAVDSVSLAIRKGEIVSLVGESGSVRRPSAVRSCVWSSRPPAPSSIAGRIS